jgi:hypothetical protein
MIDPAEITARLNAATPGPWEALVLRDMNDAALVRPILDDYSDGGEGLLGVADAEFIANAPSDIAFLLSRVAVLEAQRRAALELHWAVTTYGHPLEGMSPCCQEVWPCRTFRALGGEETT